MTKTEESHMLKDIKRTAAATERIAKALEQLAKMANYDAMDYITLGSAIGEGNEAGMKEEKNEN